MVNFEDSDGWSRHKVKELLRKANGISNMRSKTRKMIPGLSRLIGYQCANESHSAVGIDSVKNRLEELWLRRGSGANKNNVPILSTFATAGQGKTELCLQLVLDECLHEKLDGVEEMVAIHITFNQATPFTTGDSNMGLPNAVAHRVIRSIVAEEGNMNKYPWREMRCYENLHDLIADVRESLKRPEWTDNQFGILLCVDETLKIAAADSELCKSLLEDLGALQQNALETNVPTFVLVTGLHYDKTFQEFQTSSGRPLKLVTLPMLATHALSNVARNISAQLIEVAKWDPSFEEAKMSARVHRMVLWMLNMTGRHFRALEESVKRIFAILVSDLALSKYKENTIPEESWSVFASSSDFQPNPEYHDICINNWDESKVRITLSYAFMSTVQARLDDEDLFNFCCDLFCNLVYQYDQGTEEAFYVVETEMMIRAETLGVVFIKKRKADTLSSVQPRVSLPYLFNAARTIFRGRQRSRMMVDSDNPELLLKGVRGKLSSLLPALLANIGVCLNGLVSNLPTSFELVMPFVELFRIHIFSIFRSDDPIQLEDVLPGIIVKPRSAVTPNIQVPSWVLDNELTPMERLPRPRTGSKDPANVLIDTLKDRTNEEAEASSRLVALMQPTKGNTKGIEYAARHVVEVNENDVERPLLWLASMKLREASTSSMLPKLARRVHEVASESQLSPDQYYAVLYGCWPRESVPTELLLENTVVVPSETIQKVLRPFVGGCLELVMTEKCNAGQRGITAENPLCSTPSNVLVSAFCDHFL